MKLCIDTCTNVCSVALVEENKVIAERLYNDKLRHSEILMVEIDDMINKLERTPNDIEEIFVSNGPGSFTGIRIGVTTANTLADVLNIKVKGYSVLDVIAYNSIQEEKVVCSMLDARNDRYYCAFYKMSDGKVEFIKKHEVMNIDELLQYVDSIQDKIIFCGEINELHRSTLANKGTIVSDVLNIPRAAVMPFINSDLVSNELIDDRFVKPSYLEKSQAERQAEMKNNG